MKNIVYIVNRLYVENLFMEPDWLLLEEIAGEIIDFRTDGIGQKESPFSMFS
jgi:hypothetical protein